MKRTADVIPFPGERARQPAKKAKPKKKRTIIIRDKK